MSRTLSTNCGSADNLNGSRRCDCNPKVCQIREIVAFERPTTSAMLRVLHWVAIAGGASRVRVITSTTASSVILRGVPGRGSSVSPSRPPPSEALSPLADAILRYAQSIRHRSIGQALGAGQDHARALRQTLGRGGASRPLLQRATLLVGQQQRFRVSPSQHARRVPSPAPKYKAFSETRH